MFEID